MSVQVAQAGSSAFDSCIDQAEVCVMLGTASTHCGHPSCPANCILPKEQEVDEGEASIVPMNELLEALGPDYQWVYQLTANTGSAMYMDEPAGL